MPSVCAAGGAFSASSALFGVVVAAVVAPAVAASGAASGAAATGAAATGAGAAGTGAAAGVEAPSSLPGWGGDMLWYRERGHEDLHMDVVNATFIKIVQIHTELLTSFHDKSYSRPGSTNCVENSQMFGRIDSKCPPVPLKTFFINCKHKV